MAITWGRLSGDVRETTGCTAGVSGKLDSWKAALLALETNREYPSSFIPSVSAKDCSASPVMGK